MTEERTTTPAEIDEALSRRISDALNAEDGIAGDPDLAAVLAADPSASLHAKHLARVGRWLAMWPVETPSESDFEALAAKIEARLGESFDDDFSLPPEFESETRPPTEEGKAPIARIPLRRSPRGTITELSVIRNDPRSSDEEISLETLAIAAATEPLSQPFTLPKPTEKAANDLAEQPSLEEVVVPLAAKPSVRPVSVPPPATKSERPKPAIVPKPRAVDAQRAAPPPTPKETPPAKAQRSWWPGFLAAAAVGIGAMGVASVSMNNAASPPMSTAPAMAVEVASPQAAPAAVPEAPAPPTPAAPMPAAPMPMPAAPIAPVASPEPAASTPMGGLDPSARSRELRPRTVAESDEGIGGGGARTEIQRALPRRPSAPFPAVTAAPAPTAAAAAPSEGGAPRGAPARRAAAEPMVELSREVVASVMQGLLPEVRSCANGRSGTIPVDVIVQPSGRVTGATVTGSFQGTPEGSCIARAVRSAQFPPHDGDQPTRFRYPYAL